jgi:hypothetical protein
MASSISAGNATNGVVVSSDNTGALNLITGSGSGTTAVSIDSSQNVGVGTLTPAQKLDVVNGRIRTAGSSGNSGYIQIFNNANTTGQLQVGQGLVTGTDNIGYLWNIANANLSFGTNNTERMTIDSSGSLLVNSATVRTNTGGITIEADGSSLYLGPKTTGAEGGEMLFGRGTDKAVAWTFDVLSGASPNIRLINGSAVGVQLVNGATAWSAYSDINLKTNITPLRSVINDIGSIECINYHLKDSDTEDTPIRVGVSAQSLVGKFDEVVDTVQKKQDPTDYLAVRYSDMVPYLIKAIQELKAELDALKAKVGE